MLPIGGLLIALCLGWKYGLAKTMQELDIDTKSVFIEKLWAVTIKYVSPLISR